MTNLELPLNQPLAKYVEQSAAAAGTSPAQFVQRLIQQQKAQDQTRNRAMMGYYLQLVEKEANQKGWTTLDSIKSSYKKSALKK